MLTRWSSWLVTCFYYTEHFDEFQQYLYYLSEEESKNKEIKKLQDLMNDPNLRQELGFITATFKFLPEVITEIQRRLPLLKQFELLDKVISNVNGEQYKNKLESIQKRNPDINKMCKFALVISGERVNETSIDPLKARIYKNAPLVSAEIERVFSSIGEVLSPQRMSLNVEYLKHHYHLIIYWYNTVCN